MREHIEVVTKEPTVYKLFIFDDVNEYLEYYSKNHPHGNHKEWTRVGYGNWVKRTIKNDENTYYSFSSYDDVLLIEKAYNVLLEMCEKKYSIHESDLLRTQRNSNTRYTGELESVEHVIDYMRDEERSWLPNIYNDIQKEINKHKKEIERLNKEIDTLKDDEYLKSKIDVDYKLHYIKESE